MPLVSFDDILANLPKNSSNISSKEGGTLVNPPDKLVTSVGNLQVSFSKPFNLNPYINGLMPYAGRLKFLTIRPHDQFIFGRYNVKCRKDAIKTIVNIVKENIPYPYGGSIESNNKIFCHVHLVILCSNSQLESLQKNLRDLVTCEHLITGKQHAVLKRRPPTPGDRYLMIKYYLGLKYNPEYSSFGFKPSYLKSIFNECPYNKNSSISESLYKEFLEIKFSKSK